MSQSREEILANFQECTGVENVEEAIMWLESAQWDLLMAINNAVPQDEQMSMYGDNRNENDIVPVTISNDFTQPANDSERTIEVFIHFHGNIYKLRVPESMNVGCVKTMTYADTKVPVCQQVLSGWPNSGSPISDETSLRSLKLPNTLHLFLITRGLALQNDVTDMEVETEQDSKRKERNPILPEAGDQLSRPSSSRGTRIRKSKIPSASKDSNDIINLKIHDGNKNKEHNVAVPRNSTVNDVKKDAENLTGIPIAKQTWLGWPDGFEDTAKLNEMNLDQHHELTVVSLEENPRNSRTKSRRNLVRYTPSPDPSDSGADNDSFEDASESFSVEDEMFNEETPQSSRIAPLMPDNVEDETIGSVSFIDGYTVRYGQNSPNFFSGPLENAINEAFLKNGRDKKMLAIYLHHDGSILSNVFCSELLGSESVLQIFATYFVVWGWDVTNRRNREMLLESVSTHLGHSVAQEITGIRTDDFPALLIVSRVRSNVELLNVIRGNIGAQELSNSLASSIDIFTERLEAEIQNEEERAARDRIKFEQDMAYQESLLLDKAKEESKKQQLLLQSQEEERIKREEEERNTERLTVESSLPVEPPEDTPPKEIFTFRFRTPTGEFFIRRFNPADKLQAVFDYLLVRGFRISEYKVISPFPKKDLSALDGTLLLKDVGLCPQETLTLEER